MSDANKETIADIIAEISNYRDPVVRERRLDFRLKAAYERELAAGGDAAKLREAMCEILSYIERFHKYVMPGKGEKLTALFAVADTIRNKARAALSAPPRNCDRYASAEEADAAYRRFCEREIAKIPMDVLDYSRERAKIPTKYDWLFAPRDEEGATDGN